MKNERTVREWQEAFRQGRFTPIDGYSTPAGYWGEVGWYDWFCPNSRLASKTQKLGNIVLKIKDGGKVNMDSSYVWFKNNCPFKGPLYDDIRIGDIETGNTLMTIQINCCFNNKRYVAYARRSPNEEMDCEHPAFESDSLRDLTKWLNTKED